jgi:hypothetical protein
VHQETVIAPVVLVVARQEPEDASTPQLAEVDRDIV